MLQATICALFATESLLSSEHNFKILKNHRHIFRKFISTFFSIFYKEIKLDNLTTTFIFLSLSQTVLLLKVYIHLALDFYHSSLEQVQNKV